MPDVVGQKIVNIRAMTDEEVESEGWQTNGMSCITVLELENGDVLYPSSDDEGNSGGAIFGTATDGGKFCLRASKE